MSTSKLSIESQLVAALAAMSEANLAMRTGAVAAPAICRAARCLERLAECADLAPALRQTCDHMCAHWEASMALFADRQRSAPPIPGARVIPLRRR
jgi:hypothetical protein